MRAAKQAADRAVAEMTRLEAETVPQRKRKGRRSSSDEISVARAEYALTKARQAAIMDVQHDTSVVLELFGSARGQVPPDEDPLDE